jgi:hypothetical protein
MLRKVRASLEGLRQMLHKIKEVGIDDANKKSE